MENAKAKLIYYANTSFIVYTCFAAGMTLFVIAIIILYFKLLRNSEYCDTIKRKSIFWILVTGCLVFALHLGGRAIAYRLDYIDAKAGNFQTITGTVVGYDRVRRGNGNEAIYEIPIFQDESTGQKIPIDVGKTQINKKYTVVYLRRSKEGWLVDP